MKSADKDRGWGVSPRTDIVISIKPKFVELILTGEKSIELRRRFGQMPEGSRLLIYSSAPCKAIVAEARVAKVERLKLVALWKATKSNSGIEKFEFDRYFEGRTEGYAIHLKAVQKLRHRLELATLRKEYSFSPPQSYCYAANGLGL